MLGLEGRFCSVGGLRLYYYAFGERRAPPLVLLHDLGETADVWRTVAPELARRFHVLTVDLRGHGDSDWIDTYSPQEQGDDIGELVQVLGLAPVALLGAGMGGRAAALLAARQEHVVTRVVVVDAGVRMYGPGERAADRGILDMPRVYDSPEDYLRRWWARRHALGLTHRAVPPDDDGARPAAERAVRRLAGGGYAPKFDADGYYRYRVWSPGPRSVDYHDEFDQIACPVLLVRGTESTVLPRDEAEETAAVIPDCHLIEIPGARHDVLADAPDALLAAVLPFLIADVAP